MSLHQIIYTSCRRGINGVNDGQQVFSYDASFSETNRDDVKRMFSYQLPALPQGVVMTEALAKMMPQSFSYSSLDNGEKAFSLNTYLGRDYMGSSGRFGNYLSHVVTASLEDILYYPCDYYSSPSLREQMSFEEVNNPNTPDYLPTPVLKPGRLVYLDAVIDFLSVEDRIEVLKQMLAAVLSFASEQKRLLICDASENIPMWIAAINYSFPLEMALNIDFTTYEFNPSLSNAQICGVLPTGTRYTPLNQELYFVFDFKNALYSTLDISPSFYEFIDAAFTIDYELLHDFHHFLCTETTYRETDVALIEAYDLYRFVTESWAEMSTSEIEGALLFAREYATQNQKAQLASQLLNDYQYFFDTDYQQTLPILVYLSEIMFLLSDESNQSFKQLLVLIVHYAFRDDMVEEQQFLTLYQTLSTMATHVGFSLEKELMGEENRHQLLQAFSIQTTPWREVFVIQIMTDYIRQEGISATALAMDAPIVQGFVSLIEMVYRQGDSQLKQVVIRILEAFSWDYHYLINMSLNIESILLDLPHPQVLIEAMWGWINEMLLNRFSENLTSIGELLARDYHFSEVYKLYHFYQTSLTSIYELEQSFNEHDHQLIQKYPEYKKEYEAQLLTDYFYQLQDSHEVRGEVAIRLLRRMMLYKAQLPFEMDLVTNIVREIPLESFSLIHRELISELMIMASRNKGTVCPVKLILLWMGITMNDVPLDEAISRCHEQLDDTPLNLTYENRKICEDFFGWVLPNIESQLQTNRQMMAFTGLFIINPTIQSYIVESIGQLKMLHFKKNLEAEDFYEFLAFASEYSVSEAELLGQLMCRLSKKELNTIDVAVRSRYSSQRVFDFWTAIKEQAESTNPFVHRIAGYFKKKR